ncbi:MAG: polyphenol oxidase family protein [Angustibacter sp.]
MLLIDRYDHGARWAFTGRGRGAGAYGEHNLATHVGDDPTAVRRQREQLAAAFGVDVDHLIFMNQVHGTRVEQVRGPCPGDPPECDALVTTNADVALVVLVADCVPVVLVAPDDGVIGVAHAGRTGMATGVIDAVVSAMRDLGAGRLVGRLGPSICSRCYEVPLSLREGVAARWPVTRALSTAGTPTLDIAAGVRQQLSPWCAELDQVAGCTAERPDLFSYRRDGVTGRFAGVVRLQPVSQAVHREPGAH